ncbi:hypothetical protein N9W34_03520 [Rickettsiales bacterium]|nr:hypothetical protein [Rickettsiales bacterium]
MKSRFLTTTAIVGAMLFTSANAEAANPFKLKYTNNDWINVTGKIKDISSDQFTLDFDDGMITVEMDDWDGYDEAQLLKKGETVTVSGEIDHDLYESKKIEASTVYSHDRTTYFYASSEDEEDGYYYSYYSYPAEIPDGTWMNVSGVVKKIHDRELILQTSAGDIVVDTKTMSYNPLDDSGFVQVDVGDKVYVSGEFDVNFFDKNEIDASSIATVVEYKS